MAGAGETLAGLVFTPEAPGGVVVDSRCGGLGFTEAQAAALNKHINVEYTAMYAYHALWAYFDRDTVALPGFAKYFEGQSGEEREHASAFMKYQNKRGGKVELFPIAVPEMSFTAADGTSDAVYAMDLALQLEKFVFLKLQDLHKVAADAGDAAMTDFVEDYLGHQVDAVKAAADMVAQLKRVGTGHGVYHIDRELLEA
jgi:ferritin heavy chain